MLSDQGNRTNKPPTSGPKPTKLLSTDSSSAGPTNPAARKQNPTSTPTTKPTTKRCTKRAATRPATTVLPEQRLPAELPSYANPATTNPKSILTLLPTTFQLNTNGISEKSQKYKITALKEIVHSNPNHIPFFIITESHLKSRHYDHEIAIDDYSTLRADRPTIIKGGVVIYTHKDFVVDDRDTYTDEICQTAMIFNAAINLIIVAIYRSPRADEASFQRCLNKIKEFLVKHDGADIQIQGDLNFPYVNWSTPEIQRAQLLKSEITSAQALLKLMDQLYLTQMVTEYTRSDKSILDLVLTNNHQSIHNIEIEKTQLSDHDIVWTQLSYKKLSNITSCQNLQSDSPLDNYNLNKANWDAIRAELAEKNWEKSLEMLRKCMCLSKMSL